MGKPAISGTPAWTGVLMIASHFPPAVGGTERQARSLAAGLVTAGHRVTVLTLARQDAPAREVLDGVQVERALAASGPAGSLAMHCSHWATASR